MHFEVYSDKRSEWRWRLVASNGLIIADSGQGYTHKVDCLHGIKLVQGSAGAEIRDNGANPLGTLGLRVPM